MLSSIKPASERQATIDAHNQKIQPLNTNTHPEQSQLVINHFEKILQNWLNIHNQPSSITLPNGQQVQQPTRPRMDEKYTKQVSIPIIPNVNPAKYDEWTTVFTDAGYIVKKDQYRLTISMP